MWLFDYIKYKKFDDRSPKWKYVRSQHLESQPKCAVCGSSQKVEVHHIIPVSIDPSKELDLDNLITLCDKYCHFIFGHLMDWKSWNPNIIEDSKQFAQKIKTKPYKKA